MFTEQRDQMLFTIIEKSHQTDDTHERATSRAGLFIWPGCLHLLGRAKEDQPGLDGAGCFVWLGSTRAGPILTTFQ
jgi:hypothetical protein